MSLYKRTFGNEPFDCAVCEEPVIFNSTTDNISCGCGTRKRTTQASDWTFALAHFWTVIEQ